MNLNITHALRYVYSRPVRFEPTLVRLRPRDDHAQRLVDFRLDISPDPSGVTEGIDLDGNIVRRLWFSGTHDRLVVTAHAHIQTVMSNPFGFVLPPAHMLQLPMRYPTEEAVHLGPYLVRPNANPSIDELARRLADASRDDAPRFLTALNMAIYNHCKRIRRDGSGILPPTRTLRDQSGACRDMAALFIDACRSVGLAARFVTGYHFVEPNIDGAHHFDHELHAWAEVYLPTVGWRGYDPSIGLATADHHVALSAAADPAGAAVLAGAFLGTGVSSNLDFALSIHAA